MMEELLGQVMAQLLEAQIHEEPSFGAPYPFAKVVQSMQGKNNGERKNRVKKIEDSSCNLLLHFWSTSRNPFSTCYIPFQSSGSQESNASNSAQFRVEMKELQPLQVDHSKLKEEFCTALRNHPFVAKWFRSLFAQYCGIPPEVSRHIGIRTPQVERPPRSGAKSTVCCEVISQPFLCICEISQTSFSPAKWSLVLPDICDRHFGYFSSDFCCLNPQILLATHQL